MDSDQELMKRARTSGEYTTIWQNTGKCVFCDLKEKYIIREENGIVLTVNLYPYIDGQLMAIPRRHVSSPKELTAEEWQTIRKFAYIAKKIIKQAHGIGGMWTVIREGGTKAQMSVSDHLHAQFIPFDEADLCVWNFRELKYTPLENAAIYQKMHKEIEKLSGKYTKKYQSNDNIPMV